MADRLSFDSELIARIGWLIKLRWLAVTGTAVGGGVAFLLLPPTAASLPFFAVTAGIALYNLVFALYFRALKRGPAGRLRLHQAIPFAYLQIALDLLALASLVHFTGGVESPMALFFVFHVIIASILLQPGVSYFVAALAVGLLCAVVGLEYGGLIHHYHMALLHVELYRETLYLVVYLGWMTITLVLVAYLTTSIAARLRVRDRELVESNSTCQLRTQELAELNAQLQQIDAERTRFMVLVTHELRAPINTIYSALELALGGYASPEKTRAVLERAQKRASELLDLIRDLLDLARIREQTIRPEEATPIQVADVLREVVEFMAVEAQSKGLTLEVEVEPALAPVRALPEQIKLVWTNLLSNALKYTAPGGRVRISLRQDARWIIGEVSDTGIGIAPEDLPHVFDEFYRASNARRSSPHGTGVGLAIVQRTIEHWGGTIRVESEVGRGSRFVFSLPRAD